MASDSEASCEEDPNFAVICAFFEKFGELIGITGTDFCELQSMLENTLTVPNDLIELHVKLLRKIKKNVNPERWEKTLIKFSHTFSNLDAWEVERFGYKTAKLSSKIRILKELLEAQFDLNTKFKLEINKIASKELRSQPIGRDKFGHAYWFQSDENYQIKVYKEDLDDEKWTLVAKDREGLVTLISSLNDGDIKLSSADSAGNEDSNSLSEKPIIDTGQQDSDSNLEKDEVTIQQQDSITDLSDKGDLKKPQENADEERSTLKREREEDESIEGDTENSTLPKTKIKNVEVVVSDENKDVVVGEAVEEPVMKIQGEGSGVDNESFIGKEIVEKVVYFYGNGNGRDCETGFHREIFGDENPIVGDAIEENIIYFFGEGCGADCGTGNESEETGENCTKSLDNEALDIKPKPDQREGAKTRSKRGVKSTNNITEKSLKGNSVESNGEPISNILEEKKTEKPENSTVNTDADISKETETTNKNDNNSASKASEISGENSPEDTTSSTSAKAEKKEKQNKKTEIKVDSKESEQNDVSTECNEESNKPLAKEPLSVKKAAYICGDDNNDNHKKIEDKKETNKNCEEIKQPSKSKKEDIDADVAEETSENNEVQSADGKEPGKNVLSFDFDESAPPPKVSTTSAMRAVRKRGLESIPVKPQDPDDGPGKRLKLKGRRAVDTALRKSVEQRIEQLHGSSSDSKASSEEDKSNKKVGRFGKKKSLNKDVNEEIKKPVKKDTPKKNRELAGLNIKDSSCDLPQRHSRRIAQLKIKEQATPSKADIRKEEKKQKKEKLETPEKRKKKVKDESDDDNEPEEKSGGKKKKKEKSNQKFKDRPWQTSSDESEDAPEEEEDEIEEDEPDLGPLKSDHEFSPESEPDDDEEWQPVKRARTAKKESDAEDVDDFLCQKCDKSDHPELILLCDKCDNGWHCSCLRPPLLGIPEGDWFCPPCEHIILLERLQAKLIEYDKKLSRKEIEKRRKERLAYVGISLNNVLPNKDSSEHQKKRRPARRVSTESESAESESDTDSDEPIYQLRQRRQTKSYKFNEYDEMIKDALGEDTAKPEDTAGNLGRGKDIQTIVKGLEEEQKEEKDNAAKENDCSNADRPTTAVLKKMLKKKHRKLNCLDFDSEEEDISDEDFKGGSEDNSEDEEEITENSEDSDDYVGRKRRKNLPTRRSTRTRTKRYESDFISDSDDDAPRRKKKKSIWDESDSESEGSNYGRKVKPKKKKKNRELLDLDSSGKKNRSRIKYGGLTSSEEEDLGKGRRTRGKKMTYVDTLGSESDEESVTKKNPRRILSDDDEDFVANEEDEEDEKESEGKPEEEEEDREKEDDNVDEKRKEKDDEEDDSERERRLKRSLIVPKIYIKKPMGSKPLIPPQAKPGSARTDNPRVAVEPKTPGVAPTTISNNNMGPQKPQVLLQVKEENPASPLPEKLVELQSKPNLIIKSVNNSSKINDVPRHSSTPLHVQQAVINREHAGPDLNVPVKNMPNSLPSKLMPLKRPRKQPSDSHEPIVRNVNSLFKDDEENDDLSEPPGFALSDFNKLPPSKMRERDADAPKKFREFVKAKETLPATHSNATNKLPQPAIEIAAPPEPFSQEPHAPSVITRMLQSKPGISLYPVGRIRPKQFATMRDDDSDEASPKNSPTSSPSRGPSQYSSPGGPRAPGPVPYRHPVPPQPSISHYPRGPLNVRVHPNHPMFAHRQMGSTVADSSPVNLSDPASRTSGPPAPNSNGPKPVHRPSLRGGPRGSPRMNRYSEAISQSSPGPPAQPGPSPIPAMSGPRARMSLRPPFRARPQTERPGPPVLQSYGPPDSQPYVSPIAPANGPSPPIPQSFEAPPTSTTRPPSPPTSQPYASPAASKTTSHLPSPTKTYVQPPTSTVEPPQPYVPPPRSTTNVLPPPLSQPYVSTPSTGAPSPHHPHPFPSNVHVAANNDEPPPPSHDTPDSQPYPPPPVVPTSTGPPAEHPHYPPAQPNLDDVPPSSETSEQYFGPYPQPHPEDHGEDDDAYDESVPQETRAPFQDTYDAEGPPQDPPSDGSNNKPYENESGGEFAGLASYFSSQVEDDLDS